MASWETQATQSQYDPNATFQSYVDGRQREEVGPWSMNFNAKSGIDSFGYDIVGIKGSEVESMREAIREYVKNVQSVVDTTLNSTPEEARKAFRGEDAIAEVDKYVEKVKSYCNNVVSGLLTFSDLLANVGNLWQQAQSNMASSIQSSSAAFSEGTQYVDNNVYNGNK